MICTGQLPVRQGVRKEEEEEEEEGGGFPAYFNVCIRLLASNIFSSHTTTHTDV